MSLQLVDEVLDLGKPEKLTDEDLSLLKYAQHRFKIAQAEAERHVLIAQGGLELTVAFLAARHNLNLECDRIEEDGQIVRG